MSGSTQNVTFFLQGIADGDSGAFDKVVSLVYPELRQIARRQLRRMRFGDTLDTTCLVHEAYLKLADRHAANWQNRNHFFAISAHAMRQILVDHARRHTAQKRGGGEAAESLDDSHAIVVDDAEHILQLNEALEQLGEIDERMLKVVECRFFAGLSEQEIAEVLDVSATTVQRLWRRARAWLRAEMS